MEVPGEISAEIESLGSLLEVFLMDMRCRYTLLAL
jgi:hypothetical protein